MTRDDEFFIGWYHAYSYAVVGSNDRKYLWILSRQPTLGVNTYNRLLKDAAKQGFDSSRVVRTPQTK